MSDPQTVFRLGVAFFCAAGAAWMKFGSGVCDDGKTSDVCNGVASNDLLYRVRDRGLAGGANPMKEQDEHRGQIIDFRPAADRILMRRWAVANGFDRVRG